MVTRGCWATVDCGQRGVKGMEGCGQFREEKNHKMYISLAASTLCFVTWVMEGVGSFSSEHLFMSYSRRGVKVL